MTATFRRRVNSGQTLIGTLLSLGSPPVAEILATAGFDWLFIDAEHSPIDAGAIQRTLQAVGGRTPCMVRVAAPEELPIKQALDVGADGVIAPSVNSAEQAANIVRFARYAPEGLRGVGLARAQGYGASFQEYLERANQEVAVVVQAEHIDAVEQIESIVEVPGIDAVLIGPYDLSASLGKMGRLDDPEVVEAIAHVTNTCRAASMALGIFGVNPSAVIPKIEDGFSLLVVGTDALFLQSAAAEALHEIQSAIV